MGTNYYLHLGKRSSIGAGQTAFSWAIDPLFDYHTAAIRLTDVTVKDEYGTELSLSEFMQLIKNDEQNADSVGKRFS